MDRYKEIASKSVRDYDGFYTDYTEYYDNEEDKYVFIFGDKDVYSPEYDEFDWECDSAEEATEWFDSYDGMTSDYDEDDDNSYYDFDEDYYDDNDEEYDRDNKGIELTEEDDEEEVTPKHKMITHL